MLNWLRRFSIFSFLDNHQYSLTPHYHECIAAAGASSVMHNSGISVLDSIVAFYNSHEDWIFGHLGYDLKNEIEGLHSTHPDHIGFPEAAFFVPQYLVIMGEDSVVIGCLGDDHQKVFEDISACDNGSGLDSKPDVRPRIDKEEYKEIIRKLKEHIHRGDCYEINFCQEFYSDDAQIDPCSTYARLSAYSPNPFSVFYRWNSSYLLCASPERFLSRMGNKLLSQPIKGTISRAPEDPALDTVLKNELQASLKDRTENVMIVDLVRNDLSKVCKEGTVRVEEIYGIQRFPQVYQMVSTVSGEIKDEVDLPEIIRACFPMGSMTGAPKRRVMELIERYEKTKRGIFSGSVGYITPSRDFDFNVVIRSIMYNAESRYLSFQAGSGITAASDPDAEYEECMLKASAITRVLS